MKIFFIALVALGSISAFASPDIKKFENPTINDIAFSSDSSPNIVCNYLGYQKAISTKLESRLANAIVLSEKGIISASFGTLDELTSVLASITCENGASSEDLEHETPFLIKNPSHPNLKSLLASESSENGVCKLLGFERSASGTLSEVRTVGKFSVVNQKGDVVSERFAYSEEGVSTIRKIICIK